MDVKLLTLICAAVCIITETEGFQKDCGVNQTLLVTSGSTVTFRVMISSLVPINLEFTFNKRLLASYFNRYNSLSTRNFYLDEDFEHRSRTTTSRQNENQTELTIAVRDTSMSDNGTYRIHIDNYGGPFEPIYCWALFVMQIDREPRAILEEHKSVYLYSHPPASLVPNTTMIWLFNGLFANQSGNFIEYDGFIWIAPLRKDLFGRNITYRAIQDNGDINEVNFTLEFAYGPTSPLTLKPKKKQYFLKSGDKIPDINCSADCYPPCSVSWGKHSSGSTLSLGRVTIDNNGDYTCIARKADQEVIVQEAISVYVTDDMFVTIAVAAIGSVQACTVLVLGSCAAWSYCRSKRASRQQSFKNKSSPRDCSVQTVDRKEETQLEMGYYESLDV